MRRHLPFVLLVPAVLLFALYLRTLLGYTVPYGSPAGLLIGVAAWLLLFLIIHGSLLGWRSVRVFLVILVGGKFAAILYHQIFAGMRVDQLLLRLGGAAILSWFLLALFWPWRKKAKRLKEG